MTTRIDGIPVITDDSPREDLLIYIRLLEARLQIDAYNRVLPGPEAARERVELDQEERVMLLLGGHDKVGNQALTITHMDEQNDLLRGHRNALRGAMAAIEALAFQHPENQVAAGLGKIAAGALRSDIRGHAPIVVEEAAPVEAPADAAEAIFDEVPA